MVNGILSRLQHTINLYKAKPYLPFWGEFFVILQELKKEEAYQTNSRILLYKTKDSVPVFFHSDGRFCIEVPDFNIYLTEDEFIDNLLLGRFWPQ